MKIPIVLTSHDQLGNNGKKTGRHVYCRGYPASSHRAGSAGIEIGAIESGVSLIVLAALGVLAARAGGAPVMKSAARVVFWGALAMGLTAAVGALFGTVV